MRNILSLVLLISIFSCKNSEKENNQNQKETELTQQEKNLESKTTELEVSEQVLALNAEVKNNVIHCENEKFSIKVDNLKNGDLRYTSWDKPRSTSNKPDLVLYDGKVEQQGTSGGYHYVFKSGEWKYIIENNLIGETKESMGVFLKLLKDGEQKGYSKMNDLTIKKNYDLKTYTNKELIGNWSTPHYAVRKVTFFENGTFLFENGDGDGDGENLKGKFELNDKSVSLNFDSGLKKVLKIGRGKENTSFTLIGEGENFVKKWKK
ncbi:hypothetical protein [Polaribacter sp. NJDZ03]|uniref:hypothetical protein n=1 Tax=Polaribacter sp. NJDZ03 TaxID=2855841 RepID=UPI001C4A6C22|nr:hypothetical protein [Polaribacter sp. NJDZ03]